MAGQCLVSVWSVFGLCIFCVWSVCGQVDLGDMENEVRVAEDSAKKAMADAQRMSEDLRKQSDAASSAEKQRRSFETQASTRSFYTEISRTERTHTNDKKNNNNKVGMKIKVGNYTAQHTIRMSVGT